MSCFTQYSQIKSYHLRTVFLLKVGRSTLSSPVQTHISGSLRELFSVGGKISSVIDKSAFLSAFLCTGSPYTSRLSSAPSAVIHIRQQINAVLRHLNTVYLDQFCIFIRSSFLLLSVTGKSAYIYDICYILVYMISNQI